MSAKVYVLKFGQGDPRLFTGLTPTFLLFFDNAGVNQSKPTIAELQAGSGFYGFSYSISATQTLQFLISGITSSLGSFQYISGVLDPVLALDQSIGTIADSIGSTSVDPTSLFGYLKRAQEFQEGDNVFTASTGLWQIYNRASLGTTTLLRTKTLTNGGSTITKTGL